MGAPAVALHALHDSFSFLPLQLSYRVIVNRLPSLSIPEDEPFCPRSHYSLFSSFLTYLFNPPSDPAQL